MQSFQQLVMCEGKHKNDDQDENRDDNDDRDNNIESQLCE